MEPVHPSSAPARRWRMSIPISLGVLLLAASLLGAVLSLRSHASYPTAPTTAAAEPTDNSRWNALGYVDIEGGITRLYPLQPGRVNRIDAKENELVKAGQPIFHLEDTVPADKLRAAEADLKGAEDKLAIAEAQVKKADAEIAAQKTAIAAARKNVEKARILRDQQRRFLEHGSSTDEPTAKAAEITLQQAELAVKGEESKLAVMEAAKRVAEGYVATAQTNIKAKRIQIDEARYAVNECVIRAPVEGTPLRILVTVGDVLGGNPTQPAVQFKAAGGPLLVRAEVEQEFVGRVSPNQKVVIEDHVTGEKCAEGSVASIAQWYAPRRTANSELAAMNNDTRTLECIIKLDSSAPNLRIGQRVRVQFSN
ncbi:MAG: HlyD family secretion protein [Gemmataceae bacterium]